MALTLSTMQTEVYARGLSDLNDAGAGVTRVTRWLNDAVHEIDELAEWPYLNTTTTGPAPLTIADLRTVEYVTDVASLNPLRPIDRRELRDSSPNLALTGTPEVYYVTGGTTINVYPANTSTILTVDYWKVGPDLSSGSDAPLMPDRFRMGIVHYAVSAGLADRGDLPGSQAARADGDRVVSQMLQSLLVPQHQGASQWVPLYGEDS